MEESLFSIAYAAIICATLLHCLGSEWKKVFEKEEARFWIYSSRAFISNGHFSFAFNRVINWEFERSIWKLCWFSIWHNYKPLDILIFRMYNLQYEIFTSTKLVSRYDICRYPFCNQKNILIFPSVWTWL